MTSIITIDPMNLVDPEHAELLNLLLLEAQANDETKVFRKNSVYWVKDLDKHIQLTHDVVGRYKNKSDIIHFSVLGNLPEDVIAINDRINDPKIKYFPQFLRVLRTLVPSIQGIRIKDNKNRGVKCTRADEASETYDLMLNMACKESELLELTRHLAAKRVTISIENGVAYFYIEQKNCPGILLDQLKLEQLSTPQLVQLSINLLRAFQEQIQIPGIVHCDIKHDNIFVDPNTLEINIIDVGLSHYRHSRKQYSGSLIYMAPERMQKVDSTPLSDNYSLGLLLRDLWSNNGSSCMLLRKADVEGRLENNEPMPVPGNLPGPVTHALTRLCEIAQNDRMSLGSAIDLFEAYRMQLIEKSNPSHLAMPGIMHANKLALNTRYHLLKLTLDPSANIINLQTIILDALEKLPDSPAAIEEFISRIGIAVFNEQHAKTAILFKVDLITMTRQIIQEFEVAANYLMSMHDAMQAKVSLLEGILEDEPLVLDSASESDVSMAEINEPENFAASDFISILHSAQQCLAEIKEVLRKDNKRSVKLDDFANLTQKFNQAIPSLQRNMADTLIECDKLLAQQQSVPLLVDPPKPATLLNAACLFGSGKFREHKDYRFIDTSPAPAMRNQ